MPENARDVTDAWQLKGFEFNVAHDHELTKADIDRACELEQFDCCISVWEGYRELMAYANKQLGALDIDPTVVSAVQDKLHTRQALYQSGLTSVKRHSFDDFITQFSQGTLAKHFIKPRRGLGSLNSHSVSSIDDVEKSISNFTSAPKNIVFNEFYLENELYLEEYIDGVEVSFELLVHDNDVLFAL
jgi:predicted ATP-grasp superfamily ATP-dependent carboligase